MAHIGPIPGRDTSQCYFLAHLWPKMGHLRARSVKESLLVGHFWAKSTHIRARRSLQKSRKPTLSTNSLGLTRVLPRPCALDALSSSAIVTGLPPDEWCVKPSVYVLVFYESRLSLSGKSAPNTVEISTKTNFLKIFFGTSFGKRSSQNSLTDQAQSIGIGNSKRG